MLLEMNPEGLGENITMLICRFAGFDFKWARLAASERRELRLRAALLTTHVEDGDEYFDDTDTALHKLPLTYLHDCAVNNVQLCSALISATMTSTIRPSLLVLILSHLVEPLVADGPVSDRAVQMCRITQLQAGDYIFEPSWRKYSWRGFQRLYNSETDERFWTDDAGSWRAYRYRNIVWWLNGKRWFWKVHGEVGDATTDVALRSEVGHDVADEDH